MGGGHDGQEPDVDFFMNLLAWATVLAASYWAYARFERRLGPGLRAEIPTLLVVLAILGLYTVAAL